MVDFRNYINPGKGNFTADWQKSYMPDGEDYVEDKTGKIFDALVRSVRKGTIVRVRRLFCLAPWKGMPAKRRRILAERVDALRERGGIVMEAETHRRSDVRGHCAQMLMGGYEDIATAGRSVSKGKTGRPGKNRTDAELAIMKAEFFSRKNKTVDDALAVLARKVSNVTRGELYRLFGARG